MWVTREHTRESVSRPGHLVHLAETRPFWKPLWKAGLPPRVDYRDFLEIPVYPTQFPLAIWAEIRYGKLW